MLLNVLFLLQELHNLSEICIYPQRDSINFRNGRILAYADKPTDLNYFYESALSLNDKTEDDYNDEGKLNLQENGELYTNDLKNNKLENLKITISETNNLANDNMDDVSETMGCGDGVSETMRYGDDESETMGYGDDESETMGYGDDESETMGCGDDEKKRKLESQKIAGNEILKMLGDNMNNKNAEYILLSKYLESFKLFLDDSFITDIDYDKIEKEYNILFRNWEHNKSLRKHINKSILKIVIKVILWNSAIALLSAYMSFVFLAFFSVSLIDFRIQYNQLRKLYKIRKMMKRYSRQFNSFVS
ncbi:hypothetical protein [Plasmodium yoelii yoelii]|uniref:Uncharacterized protein n=2 Tax=Plasmodium yoelii yoelii TaxID=73239 RepID=Q7RMX0_PLAYO|nr:hypothetical protein [Plasmodium yoelii yoelii]WBY55098.1 fam-b protein [Plasmodium yoelii yoelii]